MYDRTLGSVTSAYYVVLHQFPTSAFYLSFLHQPSAYLHQLSALAYRRLPHSLTIAFCCCWLRQTDVHSFIHEKGCVPLSSILVDMVLIWDINQLAFMYLLFS